MAEKKRIGKIIGIVVVVLALGGLFYLEEMTFGWFLGRGLKSSIRKQAEMEKFKQNLRNPPHPNLAVKAPDSKRDLKRLVKKYVSEKDPSYLQGIAAIRDKELIGQLCKYAVNGVRGEEPYLSALLQVTVISALGEIKDKQGAKCLEDLLGDQNKLISCNASIALGKIGAKESIQKMIENMEQSNYCSQVGIAGFGKDGLKAILDSLTSQQISEDQRKGLELSIAGIRDPLAKPLLKKLYKSNNSEISRSAGVALSWMATADDVDYYVQGLEQGKFPPETRDMAIRSLNYIGDPKAIPVLKKIWKNTTNEIEDRELAFQGLVKLDRQNFCPEILKGINEAYEEIKLASIGGLQYCYPPDRLILILTSIVDPNIVLVDYKKLKQQMDANGQINIINEQTLKTQQERSVAIKTLGTINSIDAVNAAIALTKSSDGDVVDGAMWALGSLAKENTEFKPIVEKRLAEILGDKKNMRWIRGEALYVLGDAMGMEAEQIILQYVEDPELKNEANNLLGNIRKGGNK